MPSLADGIKLDGDSTNIKSIIHRLEDFFREVIFDYDALALLLLSFLGKGKIRLCIDRTEWDFGLSKVNILMITACIGSRQVPLYWDLLDNNSGNSNAENRMNLLDKVINLVGVSRIGILVADREFIGHKWLKYLKDKGIRFCIRVPKHHHITLSNGQKFDIESLASKKALYLKDCLVDNVVVNVSLRKLENDEYLFLISNHKEPTFFEQFYRKRWSIEVFFQSVKKRGFDLESTHIKIPLRLSKLIGLVSIAFAICANVGMFQHEKVQKIPVKKHGYKKHSFFRTGMDCLRDLLRGSAENFDKMIDKFLRFLIIQKNIHLKNRLNNSLSIT